MATIKTVPILYSAGTYGTFVEWCLYYFADKVGEDLPFTSTGSAHKYRGHQLNGISSWRAYCKNPMHSVIRTTLRTRPEDSIIDIINEIAEGVDYAVLLHPTENTVLLNLNNKYEKVWGVGWCKALNHTFADKLEAWGSRNVDDLQRWQLRDFLSGHLMDEFRADTNYPNILQYSHPRVTKVGIDQLVNNFEITIRHLMTLCQFDVVRTNFDEIYSKWIAVQFHLGKDKTVSTIVDCVVNNIDHTWADANLTIVDEAFVQMQLRVLHNLELRCYNLNEFPVSTQELRKYLIDE